MALAEGEEGRLKGKVSSDTLASCFGFWFGFGFRLEDTPRSVWKKNGFKHRGGKNMDVLIILG